MQILRSCERHGDQTVVVYGEEYSRNRDCPLCEKEEQVEDLEKQVEDLEKQLEKMTEDRDELQEQIDNQSN